MSRIRQVFAVSADGLLATWSFESQPIRPLPRARPARTRCQERSSCSSPRCALGPLPGRVVRPQHAHGGFSGGGPVVRGGCVRVDAAQRQCGAGQCGAVRYRQSAGVAMASGRPGWEERSYAFPEIVGTRGQTRRRVCPTHCQIPAEMPVSMALGSAAGRVQRQPPWRGLTCSPNGWSNACPSSSITT